MAKKLPLVFAFCVFFFILCTFVANSPYDENNPNFVKPVIVIDTAASSLKPNDTIHYDSATLVLQGNDVKSRFQVKVDIPAWSNTWQPAGAFHLTLLSDGRHVAYINTMYEGGIKTFPDSVIFFVKTEGYLPFFPANADSIILTDTGSAVSLPVNVVGSSPLSYQWYHGSSVLDGKTDATYSIPSFALSDTGSFFCIASNGFGKDTSRIFNLKFRPIKGGIKGYLVSSKNGDKLSGVNVTLAPETLATASGSDGLFEFKRLSAGTYSIAISFTGFQNYTKASIEVNDSTVKDLGVITLIAKDTATVNVKVTYDGNGNTAGSVPVDTTAYKSGTAVAVPGNTGNLAKTGLTFNGWNTKADGSGTTYAAGATMTLGTSNVILYAIWKGVPTLSVTFDGNGSTGGTAPSDTNKYAAGDMVVMPGNTGSLVKTGCSFVGWNTKADGLGTDYNTGSKFPMPATSAILYAKWTTKPTYPVIYSGNGADGGSVPAEAAYEAGATVTVSENIGKLVKAGLAFSGWNTLANGTGTSYAPGATFTKAATKDTLFAKWGNYSYVVTYDDQSATTPVTPATKTVASPATSVGSLPVAPAKTGFTFGGWFTAANGGGTEFTATTTVSGTITVYAKWTANSYTVTFDDQSATTPVTPTTKTVAAPATTVGTLPAAPVKTGFTFGGWFTAANGGGTEFTATTVVTATITVYAKWTANSYTVTFDDQSATTPVSPTTKTVTTPATTVAVLPTAPEKTGYGFGGWFTAINGGGTEFTATTVVSANITVYAKWTANSYTVTFDGQSATTQANPTTKTVVAPATTIGTLPTDPQRTNYRFDGWYTGTNGTGTAFTASTTVTQSLTVYAKWTPVYTVTYNLNNGSGTAPVDPNTYTNGATVTVLSGSGLNKLNYTFATWNTQADTLGTNYSGGQPLTMGSANVVLYAKWRVNAPTISTPLVNKTCPVNDSVTFTVVASGVNLSYKWFKNGGEISGANSASFTTSSLKADEVSTAITYKCIVSNSAGSVPSEATLAASTLTDIDGNVYHQVKIGAQVWTMENLRVTKYNDNTGIPFDTSTETWNYATTPKFCYFNNSNNSESIKKFGALYNWYVVSSTNPKKIAPTGWHVPTEAEWDILQNYLIANNYNWDGTTTGNKIGKSLAAKSDWNSSTLEGSIGYNMTINNKGGFSGFPAGYRSYFGTFLSQNEQAMWWSDMEWNASYAYYRCLYFEFVNLDKSYTNKCCGFSVRLLKD